MSCVAMGQIISSCPSWLFASRWLRSPYQTHLPCGKPSWTWCGGICACSGRDTFASLWQGSSASCPQMKKGPLALKTPRPGLSHAMLPSRDEVMLYTTVFSKMSNCLRPEMCLSGNILLSSRNILICASMGTFLGMYRIARTCLSSFLTAANAL